MCETGRQAARQADCQAGRQASMGAAFAAAGFNIQPSYSRCTYQGGSKGPRRGHPPPGRLARLGARSPRLRQLLRSRCKLLSRDHNGACGRYYRCWTQAARGDAAGGGNLARGGTGGEAVSSRRVLQLCNGAKRCSRSRCNAGNPCQSKKAESSELKAQASAVALQALPCSTRADLGVEISN